MIKKVFISSLTIVILASMISIVHGQYQSLKTQDLKFDSEIKGELKEFVTPKSLVIVPIIPPTSALTDVEDIDWYKGMYYYQNTRYGTPGVSFHYIILNDGTLVESPYSIPDRKISVGGLDNPIMVGYLVKNNRLGFNPLSRDRVSAIILDLVNKNAIPLDQIFVKDINFVEDKQRQLKMNATSSIVSWEQDIEKIKLVIEPNYLPIAKNYQIEWEASSFPDPNKELNISTLNDVKIKLTNKGDSPIYAGSSSEILLRKSNEGESRFFVNDEWLTQSEIKLMPDGDIILPNESKEYTFKIKVPFDFGEISESFKLATLDDVQLSDKFINLNIKIKRPDREVIEISSTETGYLKVRKTPGYSGEEVTRVSIGERFYVKSSASGWIEIEVDAETSGWVLGKYTKKL